MFSRDKIYELPLAREYIAAWGVVEAVRELLQNAIDSASDFNCSHINGTLRITSADSTLPVKSLLLGSTTKANDERAVGSFGEGYKLAMLVLTRMDHKVTIYNGDVVWSPEFRISKSFGAETLHVIETSRPPYQADSLVFQIEGISDSQYKEIRNSCLWLWSEEDVGERINTKYGDILPNLPGNIYVNGLFVCNLDLMYGYDVKPEHLNLERDRQTVNTFDVKFLAKNMWFETGQFDKIAELIDTKCPDLQYANYSTPELVKAACYKRFMMNNPGHIAVSSQAEFDKCIKSGMTKTVYVNDTYHSVLTSSVEYKSSYVERAIQTPGQELDAWFKDNRNNMRKDALVSFKALVNKASHWVNKP